MFNIIKRKMSEMKKINNEFDLISDSVDSIKEIINTIEVKDMPTMIIHQDKEILLSYCFDIEGQMRKISKLIREKYKQ